MVQPHSSRLGKSETQQLPFLFCTSQFIELAAAATQGMLVVFSLLPTCSCY
jgi:hypothetical protein